MDEKPATDNQAPAQPAPIPFGAAAASPSSPAMVEKPSAIRSVERVTAWVMVLSAIAFAFISILAIWGALGNDNGDIVGRSLGTIAVIAFTALVINVGATMLDRSKKA